MLNDLPRPRFAPAIGALAVVVLVVGVLQAQSSSGLVNVARHRHALLTTTTTAPVVASTEPPSTATTPTSVAPTTTTPPPVPVVPTGKGMWIWQPQYVEGGDPNAIIGRAQAVGLTHLYVRMGSSVDGFNAQDFLNALLPVAHAAHIRVIGWDFPYFDDLNADFQRAVDAMTYTTPTGDRIDGFSPDIETWAEGVNLDTAIIATYTKALRDYVGPSYLLIATVPWPSAARQGVYPYPEIVQHMDAIAPMDYWIDAPPDLVATATLEFLAQYGKPVMPIGQAYDGGLEGGPPGTPTPDEIDSFMNASAAGGARAISFWSWQHASGDMWAAIAAGVSPPTP
jgi:hypothetical protein